MDDHEPGERPIEPLVENIAMRDTVPIGWRHLYDQLIVDLYKLDPVLRIENANAGAGELVICLAPGRSFFEEGRALLDSVRLASRSLCEVCGESAATRNLPGTLQCLCDAHHRVALGTHAACTLLFDGDVGEAEQWMQAYSVHLGVAPADCAHAGEEGLQKVFKIIRRLEAGSYL